MADECGYCHSVTSAHVDLSIDDNGTWMDAFQFGEPADTTWSLTAQTFAMDVQLNYYDAIPKLSLTSGAGQIVIDDVNQRVIHLKVDPAAIQAALRPGTYVYDLVMLDSSVPPVRVPLMHGVVEVSHGVTYSP